MSFSRGVDIKKRLIRGSIFRRCQRREKCILAGIIKFFPLLIFLVNQNNHIDTGIGFIIFAKENLNLF
jgi:hypothetical protein